MSAEQFLGELAIIPPGPELNKSTDVLLELYAPWCDHFKKFVPVDCYLAKYFKSAKRLVIAKMDVTVNNLPDPYSASGFPTIYFATGLRQTVTNQLQWRPVAE
jgi:hypothetical protein